ncbi:hypothetical protein ACIBG8_08685 [Nonomuraea sp. NPDC050556]|uniref:hypothetical protein n=1 Tax=Nonomuraea sp. NPDC050556 TaxID=3364369 RepID=UPI0037AA447B
MPDLSAGTHLTSTDGACLMELVSVLAGERFSDHPRCTQPVVATVARMVNDEVSDPVRQSLASLAPALITGGGVEDSARVVLACVGRGRHQALARRLAPLVRRSRLIAYWYTRGPAHHAIRSAVRQARHLPPADRDAALVALLNAAITATAV